MASNRPAPEAPFIPSQYDGDPFVYGGARPDEGPFEEWNPTEESVRPVRGRHRVGKQRGGGLARSSTVLGVGVIAAVAGGGMASAQTGKPPVSISMPDLPSVGSLISEEETPAGSATALSDIAAVADEVTEQGGSGSDAGEALHARIMAQVEQQQSQAEDKAAAEAVAAAEKEAKEKAAAAKKAAEEKAAEEKRKAEEEAKQKAEAERLAELARQYALPTSSYTVSSTFGQAGAYWASGQHTGLDFAAPTGTLIKAVHTGTITSAGWDGSYGYKTVLTLDDGTEIWYAHQSSISVSVGQQVNTGDVIGRVGSTGNSTGAHLHLEVHTGSGAGIDPMAWLQSKGLTV
ncbi:M23 family metallopeptidase [Streptomyces sp. NPDC001812]|uniref:M23 family metallopeptidase n=1 Tax=Streptomyces cathayae TaxID=3031124 RepID=A0ABY8K1G3_9ACTN|nr:M23 family metallopeptidase [Streptomyces sp. HUAS 5]WGD42094.1 M23 family metallopeptidase [Streptomyces sp. HUAS 5]